MNLNKLYQELKRRNIFKAIASFLVIGWVILQVASIVLPILEAPDWILKAILYILIIGLPAWLVFAWIYDITPEGIIKTDDETDMVEYSKWSNRRLNHVIIGGLLLVVVLLLTERFIRPDTAIQEEFRGIQEERVAVLPFTNNTGDESLDAFGTMISEWITRGLMKTGKAKVVQQANVKPYVNLASISSNLGNSGLSFQEATGATKIIKGSYYLEGDSLIVHSEMLDANSGDTEYVFDVQRGSKKTSSLIANSLMSHVGGFWLAKPEIELGKINLPKLEAWKEYEKGLTTMHNPIDGAKGFFDSEAFFENAVEIDSTFYLAWFYIIRIRSYTDRKNTISDILSYLEEETEYMTEYEKYLFEYRNARHKLDFETAYQYAKLIYEIDPKNLIGLEILITNAVRINNLNIVLTTWEKLDKKTFFKNRDVPEFTRAISNILIDISEVQIRLGKYEDALTLLIHPLYYNPNKNKRLGYVYSSLDKKVKLFELITNMGYRDVQEIGIYNEIRGNKTLSDTLYKIGLKKAYEENNSGAIAMMYWHLKRFNEACEYIKIYKEENKMSSWALLWEAICEAKIGSIKTAQNYINTVSKKETLGYGVNYPLAIYYAELGNIEMTLKYLRKSINFSERRDPVFKTRFFTYPSIYHLVKDDPEFQEMIAMKG